MNLRHALLLGLVSSLVFVSDVPGADDTVATVVYSRIGNGYKRARAKDGTFKPEYYALSNGGRIFGTISDLSVDRVPYAQIAAIAKQVLATQNYHYAQSTDQAKFVVVLNWGSTLAPNGMNKATDAASVHHAMDSLRSMQRIANETRLKLSYPGEDIAKNTTAGLGRGIEFTNNEEAMVFQETMAVENQFFRSLADERVRDQLNHRNAQVLGYLDDLADSNDIRRYAGGGDRYNDLIGDVEESRYYIVISAYDFAQLTKHGKRKLLWQTRVSVRVPGNTFDSTVAAMLHSASKYFGQNSGHLVRGETAKASVELGKLEFLGEATKASMPQPVEDENADATEEEIAAVREDRVPEEKK